MTDVCITERAAERLLVRLARERERDGYRRVRVDSEQLHLWPERIDAVIPAGRSR